jgi:hypothetical protein
MSVLDDGKTAIAVGKHLERAARDCYDRPTDFKPRVVILQIEVTPIENDDQNVMVQCFASSKVPPHRSRTVEMRVHGNGQLLFNPDSLDNVDQETMFGDNEP